MNDKTIVLGDVPPAPPKRYVCGFLFSSDRKRVLLIRKNKPTWQIGRLNGVGGKVEEGETPLEAMRREFHEEAGLLREDWSEVAVLQGGIIEAQRIVYFFRAFGGPDQARQMTNEKLVIRTIDIVVDDPTLIPNLKVLLPLALDTSGILMPVMLYERANKT